MSSVSDYTDVRYSREDKTAVWLGLDKFEVGFLMVFVVIAVFSIPLGEFPGSFIRGIGVVGIAAAAVFIRPAGRSAFAWVGLILRDFKARATGQDTYIRAVAESAPILADEEDESGVGLGSGDITDPNHLRDKKGKIKVGEPVRLNLPGEANELLLYEMPGGFAFVFDPRNGLGIVVAKMKTTKALELEDDEGAEQRVESFAATIQALAARPGVKYVQMSDETSVTSKKSIMDYYDERIRKAPSRVTDSGQKVQLAGASLQPFADRAYRDLIRSAEGTSVHEASMTIVFNQRVLSQRISSHGGGIRGFMELVLGEMKNIGLSVINTGALIDYWHDPRSLAERIRTAYDPASTIEIGERQGEFSGVAPSEAGPMVVHPTRTSLETDSAFHRTYWISEWPKRRATIGFLSALVFSGDFRHTVTLVAQPIAAGKALKRIGSRLSDWTATDTTRKKLGRPASLEHEAEKEDIEREEEQLVDGHVGVKFGGYITVTADHEKDLETYCGDVLTAASRAQSGLRCMYHQQHSAFVASALPLGRGLI